jgi:pantoate--beta-alanine ligase
MILFKRASPLHNFLEKKRSEQESIGFVPTMGALHEGHLSLIKRSKSENDITVCSIYVNPTQFNDPADLDKYPRPIEKDIELLISSDCNVLFLPSTEEIYPDGMNNLKDYDLHDLENFLEGASRPGHFKGVANVVDRFLKIIEPDRLYLGQKDFQQVKVIEKLVGRMEYAVGRKKMQVVMCDIVREENGLAMSSRNVRLTSEQRKNAAGISRELFFIRDHWREFDLESLKEHAISGINSIPEAQVDYFEFCDADSFHLVHDWDKAEHIVCVTAVRVGEVRLLDNVIVK